MTSTVRAATASEIADAAALAAATAAKAGVTIAELSTMEQMTEACALLDRVWRPEPGNPLITPKLVKVLSHVGSYVVGAFATGKMVGACVGFLAAEGLHSHIAAIDAPLRGQNLGYAIKLHQRSWALSHGINVISWTFDPLVSRNAYFNLAKLGAVPTEYLANFYGAMNDEVNAGTETDRLLVHWRLTSDRVRTALDKAPLSTCDSGGVPGLSAGPDGGPVVGQLTGTRVLVAVPRDIESLRRADAAAADRWRAAAREVLGGLMSAGYAVTGFTRDGCYVVEQNEGEHHR